MSQVEPVTFIHSVVDTAGNHFLTDNFSEANRLIDSGATPTASLFDSLDTSGSRPVHQLFNSATGEVLYTLSKDTITQKANQGFVDNGRAFNASKVAGKGLKPVYQLYRESDSDYQYLCGDSLIRSAVDDGYLNQGVAWYSPMNNGKIQITRHEIDPVTGRLIVNYQIDPLHLGQFRNTDNVLTYRLVGAESGAPNDLRGSDVGSVAMRLDTSNTGNQELRGRISMNIYKELGITPGAKLDSLSLALNTKYGKNPLSDSSYYGFVRTTALHLHGKSLQHSSIDNSGGLNDIGYKNLLGQFSETEASDSRLGFNPSDIKPDSRYEDETIINHDLRGADWNNVVFKHCNIRNNNLEGANLSHVELQSSTVAFSEQSYQVYSTFAGNKMSGALLTDKNTGKWDVGFSYEMEGSKWNSGQNTMDHILSSQGVNQINLHTSGYYTPSQLVIENHNWYSITVTLSSPQFKIGPTNISYGLSDFGRIGVVGTASGDWADGSNDVYAKVTLNSPQPKSWVFSANNEAFDTYFYINGDSQSDDGSVDGLEWSYNGDNYKQYTVKILN